ncbi:MAG: hypothetical protein ACM3L6_05650 [Deltaproteobacteria bacterium]
MRVSPPLAALFLLCVAAAPRTAQPQETDAWTQEKGEHFIVQTRQPCDLARTVMREAEKYYTGIAERLNFPRRSDFWLWNDRVTIRLYDDKDGYLAATGEPEWSPGMADYAQRSIISYLDSPRFLNSVLPHEIAHLIFRDFYQTEDKTAEPPAWVDEGVAQWAEDKETRDELKTLAADIFRGNGLLTVSDILLLNLEYVKTANDRLFFRMARNMKDRYNVVILSSDVLLNNFYVESGSLIGYLIETFGVNRFADFCRQLSRGKAVSEAMHTAYPKQFRSFEDLENGWRAYLLKN